MDEIKRLPDAELEIMKAVWQHAGPMTRQQMQQALADKHWAIGTFQALLARLEGKGFLTHEQVGKTFLYSALVSRQQYLPVESSTALGRMFEGSPTRLVAALHQTDALSQQEIDQLFSYLQQLREGSK